MSPKIGDRSPLPQIDISCLFCVVGDPAWSLVARLQDLRLAVGPASYRPPRVHVLDTRGHLK